MKKLKEKALEDLLCSQPDLLAPDYESGTIKIIGRQLILPNGRLDILATHNETQILVVELKAVPLQEQDLCQVLRYVADIKRLLFEMAVNYRYESTPAAKCLKRLVDSLHGIGPYRDRYFPAVVPVLVGESAPNNLLAAADGCDAEIFKHHQLEETTILERLDTNCSFSWDKHLPHPAWGRELSHMLVERAQIENETAARSALFEKTGLRRVLVTEDTTEGQ